MTTREERAKHWRTIHEKQAESGLSAAAFCREHNISVHQFHWWRGRFKKEEIQDKKSSFLQLIPFSIKSQRSGVRIRLRGEVFIEVDQGFDPRTLREVIEAVGDDEKKACSR